MNWRKWRQWKQWKRWNRKFKRLRGFSLIQVAVLFIALCFFSVGGLVYVATRKGPVRSPEASSSTPTRSSKAKMEGSHSTSKAKGSDSASSSASAPTNPSLAPSASQVATPAPSSQPEQNPTTDPPADNPYNLRYTSYTSIEDARALRRWREQKGNYGAYNSLHYQFIGAYSMSRNKWIAFCQATGTSDTDFSPAHQDLIADYYVLNYYRGDWGNVPTAVGSIW